MELARGEGIRLSKAVPQMHASEDAYYVTDTSIAALADALSHTSPALLTRAGVGGHAGDKVLSGSVTLTDVGRAVLTGQQDRVTVCGIDRWLGGVHVRSGGQVWRWDESGQHITRG